MLRLAGGSPAVALDHAELHLEGGALRVHPGRGLDGARGLGAQHHGLVLRLVVGEKLLGVREVALGLVEALLHKQTGAPPLGHAHVTIEAVEQLDVGVHHRGCDLGVLILDRDVDRA